MVETPMPTGHDRSHSDTAAAPLHSVRLPRELFGGKAEQIAVASSLGLRVPAGYALSSRLVTVIVQGSKEDRTTIVEPIFEELVAASPAGSVIVRSSHLEEAGQDMRLSGFFKSVAGNKCLTELLSAIDEVVADAADRLGDEKTALALVLQSEISAAASAVVAMIDGTARIELFNGDLSEPIQGSRAPTAVTATLDESGRVRCRIVTDPEGLGDEAGTLARTLVETLPAEDRQVLYEAGYDGASWHIFQRQEISLSTPAGQRSWNGIGRKAAAMNTFKELGVFCKRLNIFGPGQEVDVHCSRRKFPVTVRFSCEEMLGLPRAFVKSQLELEAFVATRSQAWATIIHDFIDVARSFELLIDDERAYLEHVPGLWESESGLEADTLMIEPDHRCRAFAVRESRRCRDGVEPGGADFDFPPVGRVDLQEWAVRISELLPALRAEFADQLPANFHFVEDAAGNWNFLNCRPAQHPPEFARFDRARSHIVETLEDLGGWDGHSPILLRVRTARGGERTLTPLAERLAALKVPIYAQFGYLSHPAMVLRAHGVKLVPACFATERADNHSMKRFDFALDRGSDPLDRILAEEPILLNDHIRVVRDRSPIAPNHFLVLSREHLRGFADQPSVGAAALHALRSHSVTQEGGIEDWFIYERGRASFCTSGFTDAHAHLHLLPLSDFADGTLEALADAISAETCVNLEAAWWKAASEIGEYLVFGGRAGPAFLKRGGTAPFGKRFVRRFLADRRV